MENLAAFTTEGVAVYRALEEETVRFLQKLEHATADEIIAFRDRREALLEEGQKVDSALLSLVGSPSDPRIRDYIAVRSHSIEKVLEADRLLIPLARRMMDEIRDGLVAVARGKSGMKQYGDSGGASPARFNRTA